MKKKRTVTPPTPSSAGESYTTAVTREPKTKVKLADLKHIQPLTKTQEQFFRDYRSGIDAFLMTGVAGTGKSYIALYHALKDVLERTGPYYKVVIVRSAVPSRDIGHLPGDEKEKTEVYVRPYMDILTDLLPRFGAQAFSRLQEQKLVEFMITSFVRGMTIENAIIIVDEFQNMDFGELDSIITRVGKNTKIIFCGDAEQTDLNRKKNDHSGIGRFTDIVQQMKEFRMVEFTIDDICRSDFIKSYLIAKHNMG